MNTTNDEATMNKEQEVHSEENNTAKTPSAKDRVMEDGKLTFWEILYVARYFLPVLTTIGWIIGFTLGIDGGFFEVFSILPSRFHRLNLSNSSLHQLSRGSIS